MERQEATPDEGLRCYRWDQYGAFESRSKAIIWLTIFSFGGGWVGLVSNSQSLASAASRSFLSGLGLRYELFPKEAQNACLIFSSELASRGANPWPADNQPRYFKSTHKGAPEVLTASLCSNGVENGVTKEQAEARIFIG